MTESPVRGVVPQWTVGDRLGKALSEAGVTAAEMADYLDVHRNTISSYINDRVRVNRGTIRLWAMRTGVSVEWLEEGWATTPPPTPDDPAREARLARLADQKRSRSRGARTTLRYLAPAFAAA